MKSRYNQFNPKRRLLQPSAEDVERLCVLAEKVVYGGNPEHKRNPGDFGLTPPSLHVQLSDPVILAVADVDVAH